MPVSIDLHIIALLLLALVLGAMVFFSFLVTPIAFKRLGREAAGDYLGALFPHYYRIGGALSAIAGLMLHYRPEGVGLIIVGLGFVMLDMGPRRFIEEARPGRRAGDAEAGRRFALWHRISVIANLAQIIALTVLFLRLAA